MNETEERWRCFVAWCPDDEFIEPNVMAINLKTAGDEPMEEAAAMHYSYRWHREPQHHGRIRVLEIDPQTAGKEFPPPAGVRR